MKSQVDKLLRKLNKHPVDNDKEFLECLIDLDDRLKFVENKSREIVRAIIWKIAQDEGGHILHYNEWVDDNWEQLLNAPTIDGEQINKTGGKTK